MAKTTQKGKQPTTKQVAVRKPVAPPALKGSLASRMKADAGAGMEGADKDSFAIPFIKVLQDGSPQCKAGQPGYNPDARPGMLVNTVTGELIDGSEGVVFIPCAFQRRFIQWGAREAGGGFKGEWMPEDVDKALKDGTLVKSDDDGKIYFAGKTNPKKDDRVSDTRNHFGLVLTDSGPVQTLLSLTSTQIKKSKQLMGILSAVRVEGDIPPTWMNKIRVTTQPEHNDMGSWMGVRVEACGMVDSEEVYDLGKAFHDLIAAGKGRVVYDESGDEATDNDRI
jgi:hypothetical protein